MASVILKSIGCTENDYFLCDLADELVRLGHQCDFKPTNKSFIDFSREKKYDVLIFGSCTVASYTDDFMLHYIETVKKYNPRCSVIMSGCSLNNDESLKRLAGRGLIDRFLDRKTDIIRYVQKRFKPGYINHDHIELLSPYVLVKSGCQKRCSYCIVPYVRIPVRTLPYRLIMKNIQEKEKAGINQIILSGTCIGDWNDPVEKINFSSLLRLILQKTGVRISGLYLNPRDLTADLIGLLSSPRIAPVISLPIQSGCDKVLASMKRGYTAAYLRRTLAVIRKNARIRISTDIIIGFPSETKADFLTTLQFLREGYFDEVRGLIFSTRPRTVASKMPQLTEKEKIKRAHAFLDFCLKHRIEGYVCNLRELELGNLR